jgi:hypothetical protein
MAVKMISSCYFSTMLAKFSNGRYGDHSFHDFFVMDSCHVLLGRHWLYDMRVFHDGMKNTYQLIREEKNLDYIWKLMRMMEIQKATRRSQIIVRGCSVPNPKPFVNVHIGW